MSYQLGVDLGTTFTAAAVASDGQVSVVSLGNRSNAIPSVLLFREDGTVLTGDAANRRAATEPERVAREFKRRFGDGTPMLVGGVPYSAEELTAKLLSWVVEYVETREGGPPSRIVVSHPANWGPYKLELLDQMVQIAGLSDVGYVSEPHAAAVFYANQARVEAGSVVAVYDLGGGTFDAAVLRKTENGFEIVGDPKGIERLGGIDFDAAVFGFVSRSLESRLDQLVAEDPSVQAAVARLRQDCVDAKEALSSDTDVSIQVLLPEIRTEVRLTRREFEDLVRPSLAESIAALRLALESAGLEPSDVTAILLVGGSSRIPLVAQMIGAELGRPVTVDADPKHAVALGAALHGSTASRPVEQAVRTVTPDPVSASPAVPAAPALDPRPASTPSRLPPPMSQSELIPGGSASSEPPTALATTSRSTAESHVLVWMVAIAIAVVALAAVVVLSLSRSNRAIDLVAADDVESSDQVDATPAILTTTSTTTTISRPTPTRSSSASVNVGGGPRTPIVTNDLIWVPNFSDGTISVVDPVGRVVVDTVTVGTGPGTPIVTDDLIWVPNFRDGTISVVDPVGRVVVDTVTVGTRPRTPIVTNDLIWVPNFSDGTISVIDPISHAVVDTIMVGREPYPPIAAYDLIWVPNFRDGTISVVDPITRSVIDTLAVGTEPYTPIASKGLIWVPNFLSGTISAIDPTSLTLFGTVAVGEEPYTPIAAYDLIWVPDFSDGTISVIDPITAVVVEKITVGSGPLTPIASHDLIWVPERNGGTMSVIDPTP